MQDKVGLVQPLRGKRKSDQPHLYRPTAVRSERYVFGQLSLMEAQVATAIQRWHSYHLHRFDDFLAFLAPHYRRSQSVQLRNNRAGYPRVLGQVHNQPQNSPGEHQHPHLLERE